MSDIAFASATELAARIERREIGCVELLRHYFERVDRLNPALNAIIVQCREQALEHAKAADNGLVGSDRLAPVRELLGDDYSYDEIRLVRCALRLAPPLT